MDFKTLNTLTNEHAGHDLALVKYGEWDSPENVALECETCGCVLADADSEGEE
jgi:hypothetical protein